MSTQTVPLDNSAAAATWVDQALGALQVTRAHVVGHSFGGWAAMNFAIHHPERVASLGLLDPVQTFSPLRWQIYVKSIPAALRILPQSWRDKALADIGGTETIDANDPMTQMISVGTEQYVSKRSFPSRFTEAQLRELQVPVYAAMAGASAVNDDPDQAVDVAESTLETVDVRVWPNASHSLPMEQPGAINHELLAFMAQHDGG